MAVTTFTAPMRRDSNHLPSQLATNTQGWLRLHAAAIDRSFIDQAHAFSPKTPAEQFGKRLFDIVSAFLLLLIISPVLFAIAVLIKRDGGTAIFGHRRIGANGQAFLCWKFRTMVVDADQALARLLAADQRARDEWLRDFKLRHDPRVTRLGRFLRATSLDELPQLFNVLTGEMSLVGPRPIVQDEIKRYGSAFHDYACCRPGITGIWQVSGRNNVDYRTRVRLDKDYARNWSFRADCLILLRTFAVVMQRSGAY